MTMRVILETLVIGLMLAGASARASDMARPLIGQPSLDGLAGAIGRYEAIAAAGGWRPIPEGPALRHGMDGERVRLLRARLRATGDLATAAVAAAFDAALEGAVKRFQRRHGLIASGIVYRSTLDVLNVPASARLAQLNENRVRLRALLANDTDERYVLVNIPGYALEAVADGRVELRSRVVVGAREAPTPELATVIPSMTFMPDWRLPRGVVAREVMPLLRNEQEELARLGIRTFRVADGERQEIDPATVNWHAPPDDRFVFRQDPGPLNVLGAVRLNMPNDRVILLHGTPHEDSFERIERTFSAGCVRVERILDLSAWLLRDTRGWDRARIDRTIVEGRKRTVVMPASVPVRLVYLTVWVDGAGIVQFRPDIYQRDRWADPPLAATPMNDRIAAEIALSDAQDAGRSRR